MTQLTVKGLSEADAWDGGQSILPPGEYAFEITGVEAGNASSAKATPFLCFDLVVVAGAETEECNGREKKHWIYYTDESLGRLKNMFEACGLAASDNFDTEVFVGRQFIAEVFEDTYEKDDLASGGKITKTNSKLRKERPLSAGWSDSTPTASAQAQAAAPAASTPAPASKAPASTAPAPRGPANPPKLAGPATLPKPGSRPVIPGRRA